ncbi:hypothetical protein RH858_08365 [Halalkaliarchaeum sp. AArc-GB]|uniref:hypothetical protein n=1 Tax=Halalkaliarchaeum sp. AArc-GB TaxID=3074078 RepID=UPI00285F39C6|nr:hypothetical protein [Halalkaliarchaeum sp. AArc-GB]MDR5673162.1 hypothetical protein [Halalkaliarchaeum sp. AArc-GB]
MGRNYLKSLVVDLFDAVFRPEEFVAVRGVLGGGTTHQKVKHTVALLVVFVVNLFLYAGPLTLAGYGVVEQDTTPDAAILLFSPFMDVEMATYLVGGFIQNSAFITVLTLVTFVTYHGMLILTLNSQGILLTLHTIVYSVSAYLAGIFTVLVVLTEQEQLATARDLVLEIQIRFLNYAYDLFGVPVEQRVFVSSGEIQLTALSRTEVAVLTVLVVLVLYFVYSLYLGARINHRGSRFSALLALVAVLLSPLLYVAGLIAWSLGTLPV